MSQSAQQRLARVFQEPYAWFLLGLCVIAWSVWINIFPQDVIVLGGDVLQPMNLHQQWAELHYGYLGRVSLFYGVFYVLDSLGISETGQLSWYVGIFLFGAYVSLYGFSRLIFPRARDFIVMLVSLFYATNIYTLYIFTATWGFTHYQILYIFIPILTGLYVRTLTEKGRGITPWLFLLVIAFASTSFGNPAFALSLGIYFALLTGGLFVCKVVVFEKSILQKIVILIVGVLFLNAYWILPLLPQVRSGVADVSASTDIVLSDSIRKNSNAFFDTIRLLQTHESEIYYPKNFPYPSIGWLKNIIVVLAFAPFFFVLAMFFGRRQKSVVDKRLQWVFFGLFTVMAALVAHVRFPFDGINNIVFQLPGLNILRGWDKLAIYMPFLLSSLLISTFMLWQNTRYVRIFGSLFFVMTVFLSLPFYLGGIQTKMSYILAGNNKKDFQSADYSALVKIPKPYYDIADIFSKDKDEDKISRLPFAQGSAVGRINLPVWGVNGPSPENVLYSKKYIEPNGAYFSDWMFALDFEDIRYDPQWITDWYGLIDVRYIVWHKDAKQESVDALAQTIEYLKARDDIAIVTDNKWFTLYRIEDKFVFPYVYTGAGDDATLYPMVPGLLSKIKTLRERMTPLVYTRKNPREVVIAIDGSTITKGVSIVLNEKYDPLWKAEFVAADGRRVDLTRDENVRYANAWKSDGMHSVGTIDMYYSPIRLLRIGMMISGVMLVLVCSGLIFFRKRSLLSL